MSVLDATIQQFESSRQLVRAAIRAAAPAADLRDGTALGELLVRPFSAVAADLAKMAERAVASRSRASITDASPDEDVAAVLAAYGMTRRAGSRASGSVIVRVLGAGARTIPAGATLSADARVFTVTGGPHVVAETGGTIQLFQGDATAATWYFVLQVVATAAGADHNITSGTALTFGAGAPGDVISVSAYADFHGGADKEPATAALARIPAAVTTRGLCTRGSIVATLQDPTLVGLEVAAASVHGFGDPVQLRGAATPVGGGPSSCVDAFVRMSAAPERSAFTARGSRGVDGVYTISLGADVAGDVWYVAGVADPDTHPGAGYVYAVAPVMVHGSGHSADAADAATYARGAFQELRILVRGVASSDQSRTFKVTAVMNRGIVAAQAYVDRPDVRPCGLDLMIRSPTPIVVSASLAVQAPAWLATRAIQQAVADVVNAWSFTRNVAVSQLVAAVHAAGATAVRTDVGGIRLTGALHTASGAVVPLPARTSLRLDGIEDAGTLSHYAAAAYVCFADDVAVTRIT